MRKIGYIQPKGSAALVIYYDEKQKHNRYALYAEGYSMETGDPYPKMHKRLLRRYADLHSCVAVIERYILDHNEDGR